MGYSPAQSDRLSCQKTFLRVEEIAVGRGYAACKYGRPHVLGAKAKRHFETLGVDYAVVTSLAEVAM